MGPPKDGDARAGTRARKNRTDAADYIPPLRRARAEALARFVRFADRPPYVDAEMARWFDLTRGELSRTVDDAVALGLIELVPTTVGVRLRGLERKAAR